MLELAGNAIAVVFCCCTFVFAVDVFVCGAHSVANLHFPQFACNMHRDFERTTNTSKNTHVMLALKIELNFIFVVNT